MDLYGLVLILFEDLFGETRISMGFMSDIFATFPSHQERLADPNVMTNAGLSLVAR